MVTLASMFVLSEYLASENVQHSFGKLRVRGVQIRGVPGNVLNRCEMKCDWGAEDPGKMEEGTHFGDNLKSKLAPGANKIIFYFSWNAADLNSAHREEHFKPIKRVVLPRGGWELTFGDILARLTIHLATRSWTSIIVVYLLQMTYPRLEFIYHP